MKNTLLIAICILLFPFFSSAQLGFQGEPSSFDSVSFTISDTIPRYIVPDTSASPLWQIGHTTKMVFAADTTGSHGIMTDTLHPYPVNANNWFTIAIDSTPTNMIIEFWHEYQTDSGRDGGIVEFSTDSGSTWLNVAACPFFFPSIITQGFYSNADTLAGGMQAFSGNSHGQVHSSLQFFNCMGEKRTATNCNFYFNWGSNNSFYIRFRFSSDTLADTLSGWKIDSIKILRATCPGYVNDVNGALHVNPYPNPAHDGIFNFPALEHEGDYSMEVYNALGAKVYSGPYLHQLNLSGQAPGLYFFTVHSPQQCYSAKLHYL